MALCSSLTARSCCPKASQSKKANDMLNIIAHDIKNDVALFDCGDRGYKTRYGLEVKEHANLELALHEFTGCVAHALVCDGHEMLG